MEAKAGVHEAKAGITNAKDVEVELERAEAEVSPEVESLIGARNEPLKHHCQRWTTAGDAEVESMNANGEAKPEMGKLNRWELKPRSWKSKGLNVARIPQTNVEGWTGLLTYSLFLFFFLLVQTDLFKLWELAS